VSKNQELVKELTKEVDREKERQKEKIKENEKIVNVLLQLDLEIKKRRSG